MLSIRSLLLSLIIVFCYCFTVVAASSVVKFNHDSAFSGAGSTTPLVATINTKTMLERALHSSSANNEIISEATICMRAISTHFPASSSVILSGSTCVFSFDGGATWKNKIEYGNIKTNRMNQDLNDDYNMKNNNQEEQRSLFGDIIVDEQKETKKKRSSQELCTTEIGPFFIDASSAVQSVELFTIGYFNYRKHETSSSSHGRNEIESLLAFELNDVISDHHQNNNSNSRGDDARTFFTLISNKIAKSSSVKQEKNSNDEVLLVVDHIKLPLRHAFQSEDLASVPILSTSSKYSRLTIPDFLPHQTVVFKMKIPVKNDQEEGNVRVLGFKSCELFVDGKHSYKNNKELNLCMSKCLEWCIYKDISSMPKDPPFLKHGEKLSSPPLECSEYPGDTHRGIVIDSASLVTDEEADDLKEVFVAAWMSCQHDSLENSKVPLHYKLELVQKKVKKQEIIGKSYHDVVASEQDGNNESGEDGKKKEFSAWDILWLILEILLEIAA